MVQPGDVIENPVTGERIMFVRTSAETGGALAEMDLDLSPTAFLAAEHLHLRQEEKFDVVEGRIRLRCRGDESVHGAGESVVVPAGAPHAWAPEGDKGARVRLTFTPGAGIEDFFDEFFRPRPRGQHQRQGHAAAVRHGASGPGPRHVPTRAAGAAAAGRLPHPHRCGRALPGR